MNLPANWRTTWSGIAASLTALLTVIAGLPYELGNISTIISPDYKAKVVAAGAIATVILKIINALAQKDKYVTGGTVQQDEKGQVAIPQEPTPKAPAPALPDSPDLPTTPARVQSTVRPIKPNQRPI